jgi:hypothetical protein
MATRTILARASVGILLVAGVLATARNSVEAKDLSKIGPPLEIVKEFGDDFRLVGIGISAKEFATAPSSQMRSGFSMVEVDSKTGVVAPFPDAAWNDFSEQRDGRSERISVQAP